MNERTAVILWSLVLLFGGVAGCGCAAFSSPWQFFWLELDGVGWAFVQGLFHGVGTIVGVVVAAVFGLACVVASIGSWRRQPWAFWLGAILVLPIGCSGNFPAVLVLLGLLMVPELRAQFVAKSAVGAEKSPASSEPEPG